MPYIKISQQARNILTSTAISLLMILNVSAFAKSDDPLNARKNIVFIECEMELSNTEIINLAKAVSIGLCKNPSLKSEQAAVEQQISLLGIARSKYFPSLENLWKLGASYNDATLSGDNTTTFFNQGISLSYVVYDFGNRNAGMDYATSQLESAYQKYESRKLDLIHSITASYIETLSANIDVDTSERAVEMATETFDVASLKSSVGVAAVADEEIAKSNLIKKKIELRTFQKKYTEEIGKLAQLLSIAPDRIHGAASLPNFIEYQLSYAAAVDIALNKRADYKSAERNVKAAKDYYKQVKLQNKPTISLGGELEKKIYFQGGAIDNIEAQIGITLKAPIFTGFKNSYEIAKAGKSISAENFKLSSLEDQIKSDVWNALNNVAFSKDNLLETGKFLASAKVSYNISLERYKSGVGTIIDLLETQQNLSDAARQFEKAKNSVYFGNSNFAKSMGEIYPLVNQ